MKHCQTALICLRMFSCIIKSTFKCLKNCQGTASPQPANCCVLVCLHSLIFSVCLYLCAFVCTGLSALWGPSFRHTPGGRNTPALMISFGQLHKEGAVDQSLLDCCLESGKWSVAPAPIFWVNCEDTLTGLSLCTAFRNCEISSGELTLVWQSYFVCI